MDDLYIDFVYICNPMYKSLEPYKTRITEKASMTWEEFKKEHNVKRPIRREWPLYAWPGGYPLYYITQDGGILCSDCANKNLKLTLGDDPQWRVDGCAINYEDFIICDNCSTTIESAYGEGGDETDDPGEEETT